MEEGLSVHVYVDETRPRNQGASLTAWELTHHGAPHTLIVDNAGGHLMQHGLVDMVIVGSDRTTANGDVCNKIGTYLKALAAHDNAVPFYVALPSPTIDWTVGDGVKEIPIEERGADEVNFVQGRGRRRRDHARQDRARRRTRRQSGVRCHAGPPGDRAHHRARRRRSLAAGSEGAVSGANLSLQRVTVGGRAVEGMSRTWDSALGALSMICPLASLSVVEFEGIGPGPLAGRMLADLGAEVVAVVRPNKAALGDPDRPLSDESLRRGKRIVPLDLKRPEAVEKALGFVETADALIEGNRPGVMERLGLGPADCAKRNPRLVYGRMTGWGQDGPLAQAAGHDLNYLALSGALSLAARPGAAPIPPPTVLGDGGGALGLAFGVMSAVFAAGQTGKGCVIDCSIVDIVASLSGIALAARASGHSGWAGPEPLPRLALL